MDGPRLYSEWGHSPEYDTWGEVKDMPFVEAARLIEGRRAPRLNVPPMRDLDIIFAISPIRMFPFSTRWQLLFHLMVCFACERFRGREDAAEIDIIRMGNLDELAMVVDAACADRWGMRCEPRDLTHAHLLLIAEEHIKANQIDINVWAQKGKENVKYIRSVVDVVDETPDCPARREVLFAMLLRATLSGHMTIAPPRIFSNYKCMYESIGIGATRSEDERAKGMPLGNIARVSVDMRIADNELHMRITAGQTPHLVFLSAYMLLMHMEEQGYGRAHLISANRENIVTHALAFGNDLDAIKKNVIAFQERFEGMAEIHDDSQFPAIHCKIDQRTVSGFGTGTLIYTGGTSPWDDAFRDWLCAQFVLHPAHDMPPSDRGACTRKQNADTMSVINRYIAISTEGKDDENEDDNDVLAAVGGEAMPPTFADWDDKKIK